MRPFAYERPTRLTDVVAQRLPAPFAAELPLDPWDSLAAASRVRAPALVVHGLADAVIPPDQGERLVERLGGRARLVRVASGHDDIGRQEQLWREVDAFFAAAGQDAG